MSLQEEYFNRLSAQLIKKYKNVSSGKMMSSPGLKYNDKVFAFFHKDRMCFRMGPKVNFSEMNIENFEPLNPFKNKPPLKGWFYVNFIEKEKWEHLAEMALNFTRTL
jgi:hypothetical protein